MNGNTTKFKQVSEALEKSDQLQQNQLAELEHLYRTAPVGLCLMDTDLRFVRINDQLAAINGKPVSEHIGKTLREIVPEIAEQVEPIYRRVIETGEPALNFEVRGTTPVEPAVERVRTVSYYPVKSEFGAVFGVSTVVQDITEQKRAEEKLRKNEERFNLAVRGSTDGIWDWPDMSVDKCWWSSRFYELLGYEDGEFEARFTNFENMLHPDDLKMAREVLRRHIEEREPLDVEYRLKTKFGEYRWFHARGQTLRDDTGQAVRMAGSIQDITVRKETEKELSESEERFRRLSDGAFEGVGITEDGKILDANNQLADMFGYDRNELIGKSVLDLVAPESHDTVSENIRSGHENPYEHIALKKDGSIFPIEVRGRAIPYEGRVVRVTAIRDLSERKGAEEKLTRSYAWQEAIIEGSRDGIFISDADSRFVVVNRAACELTGYTREELLEMRIPHLHEKPDLRAYKKFHGRIMAGEEATSEAKILRKDGTKVDAEFSNRQITIAGDAYMHTVARDITERKLAEEALRESEAKFRHLAEKSPNMIFINKFGQIVYVNDKCKSMMQRREEEFYSPEFDFMDLIADECKALAVENFAKHKKGVEIPPYEYTLIGKDGKRIEAIVATRLINYGGDKAILGIITDITDRKWAEEALRESGKNLKLAEEIAHVGFFDWDIAANKSFWSDENYRILGYNPQETVPSLESFMDRVHPGDKALVEKTTKHLTKSGKSASLEIRLIRPDGTERVIHTTVATHQKKGKTTHLSGVNLDITERKRAEEELQKSEQKYRSLFEQSKDAICITTEDGRFVDANQATLDLFGYSREELMQMHVENLYLNSADRKKYLRKIGREGSVQDYETRWRKKNGTPVDCLFTSSIKRSPDGGQIWYQTIIRDITQRKLYEERLKESREKLRTMASELSVAEERERRQLATDLHDSIGQSLALARIRLTNIEESFPSIESAKELHEISTLIDQTIEDSRALTLELSPPILYELGLVAAIEWLAEQIGQKHKIHFQIKDDGQPKPLDDDSRAFLFKSVRELFINIVKYAKSTKVSVFIQKEQDDILIIVEDDGVGFDTFRIGLPSGKTGGFGLFHIRERLMYHGGSCHIDTEKSRGTRIIVRMPLQSNASLKEMAPKPV